MDNQEMKSIDEFKIKFDGQLHQLDANTLISSLINISTILQEVNSELNKDEKIEIKVKALSEGSFDVHLLVGFLPVAACLFNRDNAQLGANLIDILRALLELKKHLLGRKPKNIVEKEGDSLEITNESGNVLIVKNATFNIYEHNQPIQDAISNTFETLDNDPYIEGFELLNNKEEVIFKSERKEFEELAIKSVAVEEDRKTVIETATISIFKLVFQDRYKWEFYYKGNKISASINDDSFFTQIDKGESFAKGDKLIVEMQVNLIFDKTVNTWINHSYEINKVIKHIPRDKQQEFDFDSTANN